MGRGHRVFILAKVNDKYRTLAVCYKLDMLGFGTIQKAVNITEIFHAYANQIHIRRELRKAERIDWDTDILDEHNRVRRCLSNLC